MPPLYITNRAALDRRRQQELLAQDVDIKRLLLMQQACPDEVYGRPLGSPGGLVPEITSDRRFPTAFTQQNFSDPSTFYSWSSLSNIGADDGSPATCAIGDPGKAPARATVSDFGFSVPSGATIDSITVEFKRKSTYLHSLSDCTSTMFLTKTASDNSGFGEPSGPSGQVYPAAFTVQTEWAAQLLWASTWSAAEINSSDFGVIIAGSFGSGSADTETLAIDYIAVTVLWHM